ncbi:hypothetical protein SprV_1002878700 [Sparganum proliferum]
MVPRRGDAVCTSRRCELRRLAAWAERVITRRQIDVSVDRVGVRHPRFQQFSPCLVAGSRQYPRAGEVELMAFLQRCSEAIFDDYIHLWNVIKDQNDQKTLQNNARRLQMWSEKWLLDFSVQNCAILHLRPIIRHSNDSRRAYHLEDSTLPAESSQNALNV